MYSFENKFLVQCTVPRTFFLHNIINTSIPSGTLIDRDASFTYTCLDDYQSIVDMAIVRCLANGQLSHQAHCVPKSCHEHPPIILNGRRIFHSTKHGSIARYRCLPGYRIENTNLAKLTCQFGQWIPKQAPKCLPSKREKERRT